MSLGKLLAAGKSIKNGQGAVEYRKDKRVYLPKFGSPKNPFTTTAQTELPKPPVENSVAPVKKVTTSTWAKTQKMPTVSAGPARVTTWAEKCNPMSIWRESVTELKGSL